MNRKLRKAVLVAMGAASLVGVSTTASAVNATYISGTTGSTNAPVGGQGNLTALAGTYTASNVGQALYTWDGHNNSVGGAGWGWGHNANFYVFNVGTTTGLDIKMTSASTNFNPAFTLWRTSGFSDPAFSSGTAHTFSQVSTASSSGWLINSAEGGATATVGYANSGPSGWTNAAGLTVGTGTGGTVKLGTGSAELIVNGLTAGRYLLVAGGSLACGSFLTNTMPACPATTASNFNLNISTVPIPAAVWLFGSALAGLGVFGRRKSS